MSATQATVTNTQVAVKHRWNVSSLSIDMLADNQTTTLDQHIDQHIGQVLVDILAECQPIYWSIYRPTQFSWHINQHSTDMSTNISVDTRPICQPIHRLSVGRYDDQYIGQGVHKIHMIQLLVIDPQCHFDSKDHKNMLDNVFWNWLI